MASGSYGTITTKATSSDGVGVPPGSWKVRTTKSPVLHGPPAKLPKMPAPLTVMFFAWMVIGSLLILKVRDRQMLRRVTA